MNIKSYFENKGFGFYVSLALSVLMLVSGIVYQSLFGISRDYSAAVTVIMIVGAVLGIALVALKQFKLVPYLLGIFALAGLLLFIDSIYLYLSEVMVGIDFEVTQLKPTYAVTVLYAICFIVALVNCWFPQVKKNDEPELQEETKEGSEAHE